MILVIEIRTVLRVTKSISVYPVIRGAAALVSCFCWIHENYRYGKKYSLKKQARSKNRRPDHIKADEW